LKKILLVNDFERGGGAEEVFEATQELLIGKCIVKKFVGCEKHLEPLNYFSYIYSIENNGSSLSRIYSPERYKRFLHVLMDFTPDIVHLHNYYSFLSPSILNAIRTYRKCGNRFRVIFTAHDFHLLCPYSSFMHYSLLSNRIHRLNDLPSVRQVFLSKWDERGFPFSFMKKVQWIYAYQVKEFDKEIDCIITPSNFLTDLFKKKYKTIPVLTIRNPFVSMESIYSGAAVSRNRDGRTLRIVFGGRLSPEKGLIEFIHAIKEVTAFDVALKIIGEGPMEANILKEIQEHKLLGKVVLAGRMEHRSFLEELKRSDALVLPSIWHENAPLALVEGAFMNLRLITACYGGMKEMAEICGGEYLMDPQDGQNVRDVLARCYKDVSDEEPLRGRDMHELRRIFSANSYLEKLIELYND
jgi:glycosyltransferase involved in cell wall biosynthesis